MKLLLQSLLLLCCVLASGKHASMRRVVWITLGIFVEEDVPCGKISYLSLCLICRLPKYYIYKPGIKTASLFVSTRYQHLLRSAANNRSHHGSRSILLRLCSLFRGTVPEPSPLNSNFFLFIWFLRDERVFFLELRRVFERIVEPENVFGVFQHFVQHPIRITQVALPVGGSRLIRTNKTNQNSFDSSDFWIKREV